MSLDIHTAVQTALILAVIGCLLSIWNGIRSIQKARSLKFFRMRRDRMVHGWRLMFFGAGLVFVIFFLNRYAEPIIYRIYPPTPTLTLTPTVTLTSTITLTPTATYTPTVTSTPSQTDTPTTTLTPHVPLAVGSLFQSTVTPGTDSIFSPLVFTQKVDKNYQPENPGTTFQNPVGHLYAVFTYDKMQVGVQWTAIWYRGTEVVFFETKPWDGAAGGFGYTDWNPPADQWLPGEYEVQIFVGLVWKQSGRFVVEGEPPTPLPGSTTPTPTRTPIPSGTRALTATSLSPATRQPSPTNTSPAASFTPQPSNTPVPTSTRRPPTETLTPAPTWTKRPPTLTNTHAPTFTPTQPRPTNTHAPTATP